MEPVVRGVYAVFTPEVNQQESEDFANVLAACQNAFIMQPPYETEENFITETAFSMLADDSGYVGLWWWIDSSNIRRQHGVLTLS